ncbi:MAG: Mov34/MPN/PAD-1 family protein [Candidatus Bathyarchaeia archaeon]
MAATSVTIEIPEDILDAIFAGAKQLYPRESFLLLRGKSKKGIIKITDLVLAPFTAHGRGTVHFNPFMFSGDFSLVGTVHSHPSGNISPSDVDMNYFFGRILMIVGTPFEGKNCVAAYNCRAERIPIEITDPVGKNFEEDFDDDFK